MVYSLATLAWLRIEPSLVALGLLAAENIVDQSTAFAWPIVAAVAGAGLSFGIMRSSVATLTKTVQDLKAAVAREREQRETAVASERAAREKDADTWDTFKTSTLVTLTQLTTLADQDTRLKTAVKEIVAAIDRLPRRSDSPRPRDHDETNPRSRSR